MHLGEGAGVRSRFGKRLVAIPFRGGANTTGRIWQTNHQRNGRSSFSIRGSSAIRRRNLNRRSSGKFGKQGISSGRSGKRWHNHRRPKLRPLRRPTMEHGADRVEAALGLDRHDLRSLGNEVFLLQHPRLEHLPHPATHGEEQERPDDLRGEHPARARGALSGDHCRSLRSREKMPENLRAAHERNDEVLERIYIGRRFRNDTERLEKLFGMYSTMVDPRRAAG